MPFVFVAVWTHPPYNSVPWEAMSACVAASDGLPVVAAGDFNSSPTVQGQKTASTEFLKRMQCELGLISLPPSLRRGPWLGDACELLLPVERGRTVPPRLLLCSQRVRIILPLQ